MKNNQLFLELVSLQKAIMDLSLRNMLLADLIVFIHFSFILFVIFGGFLALKWRKLIWLHLTAVTWGALIEFAGWICPLTSLENQLRSANGGGYASGFIEHYIIPVIYPSALTREIQVSLGLAVILFNLFIYRKLFLKRIDSK